VGGHPRTLRYAYDLREPLQSLAQGWRLGSAPGRGVKGLRRRRPDDRFFQHPRASARRQRPKKTTDPVAWVARGGGVTTKIHALVDTAGLPIALKLTEGRAHDGRSAEDMLGALKNGQMLLATALTKAMPCAALRPSVVHRPTSSRCQTASAGRPSAPSSIAIAASSSVSLTSSNTSEPSPPATTSAPTNSLPVSNSPQQESGCDLMSRWPNASSKPRRRCGSVGLDKLQSSPVPVNGRRLSDLCFPGTSMSYSPRVLDLDGSPCSMSAQRMTW
jgi:hypothetical protein